jgi:hypothetical protein
MKIETYIEQTPTGLVFTTTSGDTQLEQFASNDFSLAVGQVYSTVCCQMVSSEDAGDALDHHVFGPQGIHEAFEAELHTLQTLVCLTYGVSRDRIYCVCARNPELSLEWFITPAETIGHYMLATVGQETFRVLRDMDYPVMQTLQQEFDALDKKLLHTTAH